MASKSPHPSVRSDSIFQPNIFDGKVFFITGGASGICYGQAEALLRHGAQGAIFGRRAQLSTSSAKKLSEDTGKRCIGLSGDVRKPETLDAAVKQIVQEFGRLDFVIAGAAGNFLSPIEAASPNAFKTVIEIDLLGTYNTLKASIAELKKTHGSFLAVSATLQHGATLLQAHASAAKAGVDSLIRTAAIEYGPFGVRTNTIAPGPIAGTEGMSRLVPEELKKAQTDAVPTQRYGNIDDIANATVYLFSPAASYVSGQQLIVDGGEHLMKGQNKMLDYPKFLLDGKNFRPSSASPSKSKL